ncbi:hypothetical protein IWZ00DRAFT_491051 [Phyllosticta capitalensis]|uniref:uncharacterized protein n=1 Tax=Phyllosticta capitalensis TaxID=121624 RepID=UPI00312DF3AB
MEYRQGGMQRGKISFPAAGKSSAWLGCVVAGRCTIAPSLGVAVHHNNSLFCRSRSRTSPHFPSSTRFDIHLDMKPPQIGTCTTKEEAKGPNMPSLGPVVQYGPHTYIDQVYRARHGGRSPPSQSVGIEEDVLRPVDILKARAAFPPMTSPSDNQKEEANIGDFVKLEMPKHRLRLRSNALSEESAPGSKASFSDSTTDSSASKTRSQFRRSYAFKIPSADESGPTATPRLKTEGGSVYHNMTSGDEVTESNKGKDVPGGLEFRGKVLAQVAQEAFAALQRKTPAASLMHPCFSPALRSSA